MSRGSKRVAVLLSVAVGSALLWGGGAAAHSFVESTKPKGRSVLEQAPKDVTIKFNEPVELAFGGIEVTDPNGARVDEGETQHASDDESTVRVSLRSDLVSGPYLVEWRVIAADGHPRKGQFRFRLKLPAPASPEASPSVMPTSPAPAMGDTQPGPMMEGPEGAGGAPFAFGVVRWVLFASLLLFLGLGGFALLVWRPSGGMDRPARVETAFAARWRPIMIWTWIGATVATAASLVLEGAIAAEVPIAEAMSTEMIGTVMETRYGTVTASRLAILVLIGAALVALQVRGTRRVPVAARTRRSLGAAAAPVPLPWGGIAAWSAAGIALLITVGLAGHAGTTSPVVVGMAADVAHLAAGALWIGGLVGLIAVAMPATRSLDDLERVRILAPVVTRFSNIALVSVAVIVLTGLLRGWLEIRTLSGLTEAYGITLLIKVGVFLPLLVLGAVNNRWTKPRIRRAAQDAELTGSGTAGLRTLKRLVVVEVLLVAVVLGITAFLVNLPPPVMGADAGH